MEGRRQKYIIFCGYSLWRTSSVIEKILYCDETTE